MSETIESIEQKYYSIVEPALAITDKEIKHIVNQAVDENGKEIEGHACCLCLGTVYKPMECNAGCADGIFCKECLENTKGGSCAMCR